MDGRLDDPAWANAPWTDDFVDIEGDLKPKPRFRTRAKMLWDDNNLYVGAEMEEPQLQATLTEHDSIIFHDNDFEVFIDPNGDQHLYSEMEMNALNATWDLLLVKPYLAGGPPVDGFELKGMRTAVHLEGVLNDPSKPSKGWSAEIAIPWAALAQIAGCPCPPRAGDHWRINFSRVEWHYDSVDGRLVKRPGTREDNWVWSPQWVVDMHRPDKWGYIQFSSRQSAAEELRPLEGWEDQQVLVAVWDAQHAYFDKHGVWAKSLQNLGIERPGLELSTTPDLFEAVYRGWHIDSTMRLWK